MPDAKPESVAVAILAEAPVPGKVKTALIPDLGAVGAAVLQARLVEHAVETACAAAVGPVTLWTTPDETHPIFREAAIGHSLLLARQPLGDQGERMLAAIAADHPTLVIGTDCPAMEPDHLRLAAAVLNAGVDGVVIPADDGGYVLIGCRRPQPALFAGIAWDGDTAMLATRRRFVELGLSWREPMRLWGVRRAEDLARLRDTRLEGLLPLRSL